MVLQLMCVMFPVLPSGLNSIACRLGLGVNPSNMTSINLSYCLLVFMFVLGPFG